MIFPQSADHPVNLIVDAYAAFPFSMIKEPWFALRLRISSLAIVNVKVRIDRRTSLLSGPAYATCLPEHGA